MNNRIRYKRGEIQRNVFFQMPKFLFEGEFVSLGNDARVLYTLLRDRHELSIKNEWVNENDDVYLVFSRENMCDMLQLSKPTVIKAMKDLKSYNLIQEERLGQGKANRIYLLAVNNGIYSKPLETLENTKKSKIFTSESQDFLPQEVKNFYSINTDINETKINENISSNLIQSVLEKPPVFENQPDKIGCDTIFIQTNNQLTNQKKEGFPNAQPLNNGQTGKPKQTTYDYNTISKIIQDNIGYEDMLDNEPTSKEMLNEIVHVITSTICSEYKDGYISMGEARTPAEAVRSVFFKLNESDIEYFIECFNRQTAPITKLTSYIRTSLFRNYGTLDHHTTNRVHTDMPWLASPKIQNKKNE